MTDYLRIISKMKGTKEKSIIVRLQHYISQFITIGIENSWINRVWNSIGLEIIFLIIVIDVY